MGKQPRKRRSRGKKLDEGDVHTYTPVNMGANGRLSVGWPMPHLLSI